MDDKIKTLLKSAENYKPIYFNKNTYRISSDSVSRDHILYIYGSALGTAKLQKQDTENLERIVKELEQYQDSEVLQISIDPVLKNGDYVTILTDQSMTRLIGVYMRTVSHL